MENGVTGGGSRTAPAVRMSGLIRRKPRRRVAVVGAGLSLFMRRALETGKELSYYAAAQALESGDCVSSRKLNICGLIRMYWSIAAGLRARPITAHRPAPKAAPSSARQRCLTTSAAPSGMAS